MDTAFAQRRRRDLIVAVCLAAIAALVPLFVKDVYVQNIMVLTLMYAALSQSWNILGGYCGQISLGHALYFGLGAYTTAILFTKFGVLPWFGMLGGGLISAAIAMALGYPCFRLRGHYFVIATIVIAEIALLLFQNWDWAGAALGIDIPIRRDSWLTFQFTRSKLPYFYFALVPLFVKDVYVQNIMVLTLMYAALSQSWNILSGYCGQISLGHALYFGLGAYTTALLFTKFGVLPWFGMLGGGLISALIAMALGYPCFRLRGHYFVIATIVIAEIALLLFQNWDWAGAALGIDIPIRRDSWLTFQFTRSKLPYFYFALVLACVAWLVTWWLEDSKWGYWWRAVKDNPDAAESLGVVVFNSKMGAAAVSAFLTAVGGSFYAQFVSYIDPESVMGFQFSLLMALPAVLGGIGTLWGPVLGAVILIPLTELTRSFIGGSGRGVDLIVYGALIVLISLARPEGLVGLFSRRRKGVAR